MVKFIRNTPMFKTKRIKILEQTAAFKSSSFLRKMFFVFSRAWNEEIFVMGLRFFSLSHARDKTGEAQSSYSIHSFCS